MHPCTDYSTLYRMFKTNFVHCCWSNQTSTLKRSADFSMLFIGFSLFLIVAAALLVGLLFRLGVEQRAGEIGVLLATGYPLAAVRRRFLLQGLVLAAAGGLLGLGGAASYAWLLLAGLRTWWLAAVGTPFLVLHLNPWSLALGWGVSLD